jgi:hypothetical protein
MEKLWISVNPLKLQQFIVFVNEKYYELSTILCEIE